MNRIATRIFKYLAPRSAGRFLNCALLSNLAIALLLALGLMLPDQIMSIISRNNRAMYTSAAFVYLLLFCLLLSFVRPLGFILSLLLLLGTFEIIHFCYLGYFGGIIDANVFVHGLLEYEDVIKGGSGVFQYLFYIPLIVIVPYLVSWRLIRHESRSRVVIPYSWALILVLGFTVPFQIMRNGNAVKYYPNDVFPSTANSYLTFSTLFFNHLPRYVFNLGKKEPGPEFLPVSVAEIPVPARVTVVIVMNEGLSCDHMSLFGYRRETTPRLSLLAADPQFVFKKGISAGIGTISTFYSFWNGIRDPRNEMEYLRQTTNLFRLAREHGFNTLLISAQGSNLLRGAGTRYIDTLLTLDMLEPHYARSHDEMFLELLRGIDLGDRNFVVLALRSAHGPYEHNYSTHRDLAIFPTAGVDYRTFQRNSYDNAVRYNDFVMAGLLEYFRSTIRGPLYVFMTSDHGQLLGETGRKLFGHGMLVPEVAHVPIMLYGQDGDPEIARSLRGMSSPTHYELTELITRALGFKINDPNAEPGVYYINGVGMYGGSGYIRLRKDPDNPGQASFDTVLADVARVVAE
ncbi:MAG: sulfatase-like hydrolase/transferase [Gammaproteobacteria bacterium]|nr:sulfatase-like hydrolase/transferase [Gammaproteobacteria bacterium]